MANVSQLTIYDEQGNAHTYDIVPRTLPIASSSNLGGVKVGNNLSVGSDGTLSVATASTTTRGVVKPDGTTIAIDSNGVISSLGGISYEVVKNL